MKKSMVSLLLGAAISSMASAAPVEKSDQEIIDTLYRGGYAYWQQARNDNGSYEDRLYFNGERSYVGSIANSGMGLVALTIGHKNGWEPEAEKMALQTLKMLAGKDPSIQVPRNATNTYIHFYNTKTGDAIGDDWSPVDSAIMLSGAFFVKRYFSENKEIAALVDELYRSTDLTKFIADVENGEIYLAQNRDGSFKKYKTIAFNEYMLVASIAKQQALDFNQGEESNAVKFWNKWYASTENLPVAKYNGHPVLSEGETWFTSQFNFLFNNFLIHGYSNSEDFQQATVDAAKADFAWWRDQKIPGLEEHEWGSGAGACPNGYCVDRFLFEGNREFNVNMTVSPHILAGYIAYSDRALDDLIATYRDDTINARYQLPEGGEVLWRYSYDQPDWKAEAAEAVDFSTFLFGLAAMDEHLGMEFFNTYNDYFDPEPADYKKM